MAKLPVPFFLSYAHLDEDVPRFLEVLQPLLKISPAYEFKMWRDTAILPGEQWKAEIAAAVARCRFGLLCVSPQFLASDFITAHELQQLLAKPLVVPVAIHEIDLTGSTMELKGLDQCQVFHDSKGRTFDGCGRKKGRREFVAGLMGRINSLLEKYPA